MTDATQDERDDAVRRVTEFLRQRDKMRGLDPAQISSVHSDAATAHPADLCTADLRALVTDQRSDTAALQAAEVHRLRTVIHRVAGLRSDRDDPYVHVCQPGHGFTPDCGACWDSALDKALGTEVSNGPDQQEL